MPSDVVAPPTTRAATRDLGLGLILPTFPQRRAQLPTATALATLCRAAEDAGATGLWACDHLYWHSPTLECMSTVALAALSTDRALVGPCVLQLPLRGAPEVAKQAASLQHLSGGRMVLGVGVGTHAGEYEAAGIPFSQRGRRLDTSIDELRRAWGRDAATPDSTDGYRQLPIGPAVPIWVGGSSEVALRRAAVKADGWIPLFLSPDEYAAAIGRLDKEVERAARDPRHIDRGLAVFVAVGDEERAEDGLGWMSSLYGLPARAFARHLVSGDARSCATTLLRYFEAGAGHIAVFVTDDDPLVQFEDLAGEVADLLFDPNRTVPEADGQVAQR